MPCSCGVNAILTGEPYTECACATDPNADCTCGNGGAPSPSDRELALERVVMQLDKRLRALERTLAESVAGGPGTQRA